MSRAISPTDPPNPGTFGIRICWSQGDGRARFERARRRRGDGRPGGVERTRSSLRRPGVVGRASTSALTGRCGRRRADDVAATRGAPASPGRPGAGRRLAGDDGAAREPEGTAARVTPDTVG